jgi:multiple sugar transport system substrate-binding protein
LVKPAHRILYGLGCLLLLLSCSACFDSAPQPPARASASITPVTITALVWAPDWPQELNRIADEFMQANPDVLVEVQFMIGNSVEENIKPKLAANHLPDLVSINPNAYASQLADQGWLVDLQDTPAWANMLDSLKPDWTSAGGRHFGIAGGVASTLIYYNEAMFAKAGVTQLPADFDEFLALCEKLRRAGFVPMMWNGGFPNMIGNGPFSAGFAQQIVARHPDWKQGLASGRLDLDTPETAAIFARIKALPDKGYVQKDYLQTGYDDGIELFRSGRTAMAFQGTWAAGLLMHANGFTTGVMAPPWNAKGEAQVPVLGSETGFAVCATPHRKAALRFLDFIYGKGFSIQQNKRQNLPPLKQVVGPLVDDAKVVDYVRRISAAPLHGGLYYAFLPAGTIDMLHPLLQGVLSGAVTPQAAARSLDQSVKAEARGRNK